MNSFTLQLPSDAFLCENLNFYATEIEKTLNQRPVNQRVPSLVMWWTGNPPIGTKLVLYWRTKGKRLKMEYCNTILGLQIYS